MLPVPDLRNSMLLTLTVSLLFVALWQGSIYLLYRPHISTAEEIPGHGEEGAPEPEESPQTYHVAVDPGHGGFDPGAPMKAGIVEKELTLIVSLLLRDRLEEKELNVFLTREEDVDFIKGVDMSHYSETCPVQVDLIRRAELIREAEPLLFVSIHVNTFRSPSVWGAQALYHPSCAGSEKLAVQIQEVFREELNSPRYAISYPYGYLAKLLDTGIPSVILEVGYMTNPQEAERLLDDAYQEKIARAIATGIGNFIQDAETGEIDDRYLHDHLHIQ